MRQTSVANSKKRNSLPHFAQYKNIQPVKRNDLSYLGRVGTFEENNDDPEVVLKFSKKQKKEKAKKSPAKVRTSPKEEVKMEVN